MTSYLSNQKSDLLTASPPSLLKKRSWKPSALEIAVLQMHFEKNNSPSKEDKEQLLIKLKSTFETDCSITQLDDWFQIERKNTLKRVKADPIQNSSYVKFGAVDLKLLNKSFELNNYPENEEMKNIADKLGVKISKIENWYKHHRRSLAKKGEFDLKTKRYFNRNEVNYLMHGFQKNSTPSPEEILAIAKEINCTELQIKNWYSNKRKKSRHLYETQKNETLNYSELPQARSSYEEPSSCLPSGLTAGFNPYPSPSGSPLDSSQREASEISSLPDESQWSIKRSYLSEDHGSAVSEASCQQQPASINFDSFSIPKRASQDLYPYLFQSTELRGKSPNIYIQNSSHQVYIQTPALDQRNHQTGHLVLLQNPIGLNFSNISQNSPPATGFQLQPDFLQTLLNVQRATLALPLRSLQNLSDNAGLLLNPQNANIQTLLYLRARNALIQAQHPVQINQNLC